MSDRQWPPPGTPDLKKDFEASHSPNQREEKIATPRLEMHLRPEGQVVQQVHTQLDEEARMKAAMRHQNEQHRRQAEKERRLREEFSRTARDRPDRER